MGVIDTPIGDSCFELIRDRIFSIIADELFQQAAITYDDDFLDATVYLERSTSFNHSEFPAVNVYYAGMVPLRETKNTAHREYRYFIDFFGKAPTTNDDRGDKLAAIKIERLMAVVDKILRDKRYITLGFTNPKIMNTRVESMEVGKPIDSKQATDSVLARLEFIVTTPEDVMDIQPRSLPGFTTQVQFPDGNGYVFSGSNPPVAPDIVNNIYVNNELIIKLTKGEDYNTQVVSGATGLPIGAWDTYLEQWVIGDSTISNSNDSYLVDVPSEQNLELPDITHTDSDGTPVTLPAQTPLVCTPNEPVNTANIIKTGQTTSAYAGDDGSNQFGRLTNFTTLEGSASDYPHNSLNRFCDLDGLQVYGNDIVVDMSTWNQLTGEVLMWYRIPSANIQGDTAISDAQTQTYGTFTNWFIPNVRQLDYIFDWDITGGNTRAWNYAPFNIDQLSVKELWTSTGSELAGRLMTIQSNENRLRRFTTQTSVKYIPCRVGNISECNF